MTLINLAALPIILVLYFNYKKGENKILAICFLAGVLISIPSAFLTEYINAPIVEEGFKFIALILITKNNSKIKNFIAYSIFISMGLATVENFLYALNANLGGIETAILRAIFSVPGHAVFGFFMGYFFGRGSYVKAIVVPIILHTLFNLFLTLNSLIFYIFFVLLIIFSITFEKGIEKNS